MKNTNWIQICITISLLLTMSLYSCTNKDNGSSKIDIEEIGSSKYIAKHQPIDTIQSENWVNYKIEKNEVNNLDITNIIESISIIKIKNKILADSINSNIIFTEKEALIGDLNHDGEQDIILPFEYRKDDNTKFVEYYYIIIQKNDEELIVKEIFFRGSNESELLIKFHSINEEGIILGNQYPNLNNKYKDIFPIKYHFIDDQLYAL